MSSTSELRISGLPQALTIGATGIESVLQNVRIILTTLAGELPLDREFAGPGAYIDQPVNVVKRRAMVEWIEAIETHEPRVIVTKIEFTEDPDAAVEGRLYPVATVTIKEEYLDELAG